MSLGFLYPPFVALSHHSHENGRIIWPAEKNLTGHFVHPEPFNIFALFTPNWRTRLNFNFFQSVVLLSAHAQSVTLADPQWRNLDPSASTRSHARYAARSPAVVRTWMDQSETLLSSFAETPPETILLQGFPELFIPGRHAQKSSGVEIAKWRIHATTPLPHKDLDDNGVYSAPVKFSTVPALISSLALGFWTTKRKYFHTLSWVSRVQKT